jgi:hypothetical protein
MIGNSAVERASRSRRVTTNTSALRTSQSNRSSARRLRVAPEIFGRVLHTVSRQLDLPAAVTLDGYLASRYRERHLQLIRER